MAVQQMDHWSCDYLEQSKGGLAPDGYAHPHPNELDVPSGSGMPADWMQITYRGQAFAFCSVACAIGQATALKAIDPSVV